MKYLIWLILAATISACTAPSSEKKEKKNIVFILADDLGYAQLGCYGSDYYETPNIDKLASEGMRFTNAYAACPVCSPTRASLMTGKYPARLHLTDFIAGNNNTGYPLTQPNWQKFLPLEEKTFAEILKDEGYQTAIFGKWHLSEDKTPPESLPFNPDKQGFDETFITYKPVGNMAQPWQDAENDAHNVDTITSLTLNFIERNKNNPFLVVVSHNTIHDPLKEKQAAISKYENKKESELPENHPVIGAMIERLDKSSGQIIDKIKELKLEGNTVVIFFSDNGGKHDYAAQTPLRAGKGWLYEGGIREPLIVKWPGKTKPGSVSTALINSIDFLPTFLDIANAKQLPENIDGKSFVPALENQKTEIHKNLFWHYPHYHKGSGMKPAGAVRSGKYKLIEWYEPLLLNHVNAWELYDLENDIGETTNLADSLPQKSEELKQLLHEWRNQVDAQMPTVNKNATLQ